MSAPYWQSGRVLSRSTDKRGARFIVYGLPGGYLTVRRADESTVPHRPGNTVRLLSFRSRDGAYGDETRRKVREAYGWVHRTHEVR